MKPKDKFEYGGLWLHASEWHALNWRMKGDSLIPPVEDFHKQLMLARGVRDANV